jgi:hypothetical protein
LTGLVAARPPVSKDWLVHSLLMKDYREGRRERLRELIVRAAPPVVVTGQYRFGFLDAADAQAVARYYLPITRELQALGARLPSAGNVELLRSGFYLARGVPPAQSAELGQIDQRVVRDGERLWLARGAHRSQLTEKAGELVWVGPARVLPTPGATDPPLFEAPELPGQL